VWFPQRLHFALSSFLAVILVARGALPAATKGLPATHASIDAPTSLAVADGHLFIIEQNRNKVLSVDLQKGTITTVAGNGKKCCYKDGARASEVSLGFLWSLAADKLGNLFLADDDYIRKVDTHSGEITTVAGDGTSGSTVEGAPALLTHFKLINGLAVDEDGNLFIADREQGKIFRLRRDTGTVHLVAGRGGHGFGGDEGFALDAILDSPESITFDKFGDLIISDFENCRIRRVDHETGRINTIAVTDHVGEECSKIGNSRPGPFPDDVATDLAGNVYFLEGAMDLVLRIDAHTSTVSVLAGTGKRGFAGDGGLAINAELSNPSGLAVDSEGNVFIAEYVNNRIRRVDSKTGIITTIAGNGLPHRLDIEL
jgi:trimeric autotransporter adhesin